MMTTRTTVGLAVGLAALCALYWVLNTAEQRTQERQEAAKRIFAHESGEIALLRIQVLDEKPVAARRDEDGTWTIVEPFDTIPADQSVWSRMADKLDELTNERTVEANAQDVAPYGLSEPVLTLEAETTGGEHVRVVFGAPEPTQTKRYARAEDGSVFLVLEKSFREFNRPLINLRERQLFAVGDEGITWLRFTRLRPAASDEAPAEPTLIGPEHEIDVEASVAVVLERDDAGRWHMIEPVEAVADQEKVSALVTELQYAVGRGYVERPERLADYGLNPAGARLAVRSGDGPERVVDLGWVAASGAEEGGGLYVRQQDYPAVFLIDAHLLTLLPKEPSEFRDRHLFTGEAAKIREVHYAAGDTRFVLAEDADAGWRVGVPGEGEVVWCDDTDQTSVSAFLSGLKVIELATFVDEASGLDDPRIDLNVTYEDGSTGSIQVGGATGEKAQAYFVRQESGALGTLGAFQVNILSKSAFDFREKRLLHFETGDVTALDIRLDGAAYRVEQDGAYWRLAGSEPRRLPGGGDVTALIEALAKIAAIGLEAETAPADLAALGLDAPAVRIAIERANAAPVGPLSIGGVAGTDSNSRFAMVAGRSEVFLIKQEAVDAVRETVRAFQTTAP